MSKIIYKVCEYTREYVTYRKAKKMTPGCTIEADDLFPEIIYKAETLEEAQEELSKHPAHIEHFGNTWMAYEYYIEKITVDEEGEEDDWMDYEDGNKITQTQIVDALQ